jgi:hypothetical protein
LSSTANAQLKGERFENSIRLLCNPALLQRSIHRTHDAGWRRSLIERSRGSRSRPHGDQAGGTRGGGVIRPPLPLQDARRCGRLNPGAVMRRPDPGEWRPRMPERLDEEELADWRAGQDRHAAGASRNDAVNVSSVA